MKRKTIVTTSEEWKELPESFIWTTYHLQLKRIGKNISRTELSFLLGKPKHYTEDVEMFNGDYTITDLAKLLMVYGHEKNNIFPNVSPALDNKRLTVSVTSFNERDRIFYFAYSRDVKTGQTGDLLYKLIEFCNHRALTKKEKKLKAKVKECVESMLEVGLFKKGLEPMFIYQECCKNLQETITPTFISDALDSLIATKKLVQKTGVDFQVFYYQQIEAQ